VRRLLVIGIGAGDPGQLTLQAVEAISGVDVFFVLDKGDVKAQLTQAREAICARHAARPGWRIVAVPDPDRDRVPADYDAAVTAWHEARADRIEVALLGELDDDGVGAILVWGDPSLYDSTLRIVDDLHRRGRVAFDHEVIPGVTALSALAARHRIALHGIGEPFLVTTGRRLRDDGWPAGVPTVVVLLDADPAATIGSLPPATEVFWSAYLGLPQEVSIAGPAGEVVDRIAATRAAARADHGWIMDVYLLRRRLETD
jgi:precorrin-6A synthase